MGARCGCTRWLPATPGGSRRDSRLVSPLRACDVVARGEDLAVTKVRAAAGDGGDGDDERGAVCGPQVALPVRVDDNLDETTLCLGTARESDVQLAPPRIDGHLDLAPRAVPGDELQPRLISAHLGSPRRISAHLATSDRSSDSGLYYRKAVGAPRGAHLGRWAGELQPRLVVGLRGAAHCPARVLPPRGLAVDRDRPHAACARGGVTRVGRTSLTNSSLSLLPRGML